MTDDEKLGALYLRMLLLAKQEAIAAKAVQVMIWTRTGEVTLQCSATNAPAGGRHWKMSHVASANPPARAAPVTTPCSAGNWPSSAYEPYRLLQSQPRIWSRNSANIPKRNLFLVLKSGS